MEFIYEVKKNYKTTLVLVESEILSGLTWLEFLE